MSRGRGEIVKKCAARLNGVRSDPRLVTMARPLRLQIAGGIYHVTSRGNRRQSICYDDHDRRCFLSMQDRVVARCGWRLHAYCLMDNHFHLLIETPKPNLSVGMQRLKCEYAAYFNARHALEGHLFQQRFGSRVIESEEYFSDALRYIALNPVRAGLCGHPSEWPWSSFRGRTEMMFDR